MNDNKTVIRNWGRYSDHYRSEDCVCKTLYIEPGKAISYQFHNRRSEFWYIQEGKAEMTINDYTWNVGEGFTINIHCGTKHKVKNTGETTLMIHEMQYGYCDESDIVRLDE